MKDHSMQKIRLSALAIASALVVPDSFAQFADAVVAYVPGTGVSANCTNPAAALGEPPRVTPGPGRHQRRVVRQPILSHQRLAKLLRR